MKQRRCILSFLLLALISSSRLKADDVQITFMVQDDFGKPVQGATVGVATFERWLPGEGFGEDVYKNTEAITDTNGVVTINGTSPEPTIKYGIKVKEGFYYTRGGEYTFKSQAEGRWQPWNPTIMLVLKPIVNPIPMYARKVGDSVLGEKIPTTGKPVGFDLIVGDWVSPYGKGKVSDLIFQINSTIIEEVTNSATSYTGFTRTWTDDIYDNRLTLRFSNTGDGIQFAKADRNSDLPLPRIAPIVGYQPMLSKREWIEVVTNKVNYPVVRSHSDYDKNADYFLRVRTEMDADGNITNALYGKIYGDFSENLGHDAIRFTYYLNPKPNSRNMEFDPKQNLFKNLPQLEQVTAP